MSVSVALASYNGELFLGRQLESIARQTQLPDQVVVSDGGSDDGSVELVRDFFAAHPALGGVLVADGTCLGVSAKFIEKLRTAGEFIPAIVIGRCVRWDPSAVQAYAHSMTEKTAA